MRGMAGGWLRDLLPLPPKATGDGGQAGQPTQCQAYPHAVSHGCAILPFRIDEE
jgi:hypothetical protein